MTTSSLYRILIIEDDLHLLSMYAKALKTEGYLIRAVSTVEEARLMIEHHPFDLILTDVQLGGICCYDPIRTLPRTTQAQTNTHHCDERNGRKSPVGE